MSGDLHTFLKPYITTGQKDEDGRAIFTHTSLKPRQSYYIPMEADVRKSLAETIANALVNKKTVHLTEKALEVCCIRVDIDLKYPMDYSVRQHNIDHIKELVNIYANAISTFLDLPEDYPIDAYVFQRDSPYPCKGNMKDGIHILYPDICCHIDIQYAIRTEALKKLDLFLKNPQLGILDVKNSNDDVLDKAVISTNWLMYGSRKPGVKPYLLYKVLRLERELKHGLPSEFGEIQELETPSFRGVDNLKKLIYKLSIHNIDEDTIFEAREEVRDIIENVKEKKTKEKKTGRVYRSATLRKQTQKRINEDDKRVQIQEAKKLVELLAEWRADNFDTWIEVGLCLHNISPCLEESWQEFSKKSDKWKESDAVRWYGFAESSSGLNIGSLHRWARLDNPSKYNEVRRGFLESIMISSVSGTSQDVAKVIYKMYQHQYVCLDGKGRRWAEYVNHGWKICPDDMSLKKKIGDDVLAEYLTLINRYNTLAISAENKEPYIYHAKSLSDVSYRLRNISFKDKIMRECVILFYDSKFELSLDDNPFLVGLENGVYDLKEGVFRDGRPEDRVSLSTGNDFPDFDDTDIDIENECSDILEVQEIFDFMKQILPIKPIRHYFWKYLASCLQGYNTDEKFHILTGSGGNGKSKVIELFEMSYGQYTFKIPISLITGKRQKTGDATPELVLGRKARFGSMQEPDDGSKINSGLMKEMSGNDRMYLRDMYSGGEMFKPQFCMALLCNEKPKMASDDDGSWRRLVVVEFISRFVEGKPSGPYEFERNNDLVHNFPYWSPWFFAVLTLYYKIYKIEGLNPPKEILDATYEYRKDSDAYASFISEYFMKDKDGCIKLEQSYFCFKEWFEKEYNDKVPTRRSFKLYIERALNQNYNSGKKCGWFGWSLVQPEKEDEPQDLSL
jgi:P4 family phage/plasmid primase-like protien